MVVNILLKGWCTWHKTWLQMMMLGPLSRVMVVRQLFCAKITQNLHFLCAKFSPARPVPYFQLTWALLWSNRTTQQFNTTAGVQKLCHRMCWETIALQVFRIYGTASWFYDQVSWKYGTARAGLNFAQTKCKFCSFFAQNSCLTIITLLRGPNIIIWSHVLCQVHHPFKCVSHQTYNISLVEQVEGVSLWTGLPRLEKSNKYI